jgi:ribonuclease E
MSDPLDSNDDWAELARELERSTPPKPATPVPVEPPIAEGAFTPTDDAEPANDEEFADADGDESDTGTDAEGEATEGTDAQPGTGRKRRRRRRRRRKGGGTPAEGAPATANADSAEITSETEIAEAVPVADADDYAMPDSELSDEYEQEPAPRDTEEDTATEVLRELIANWNVPSWDSIVSGLYRP